MIKVTVIVGTPVKDPTKVASLITTVGPYMGGLIGLEKVDATHVGWTYLAAAPFKAIDFIKEAEKCQQAANGAIMALNQAGVISLG